MPVLLAALYLRSEVLRSGINALDTNTLTFKGGISYERVIKQ